MAFRQTSLENSQAAERFCARCRARGADLIWKLFHVCTPCFKLYLEESKASQPATVKPAQGSPPSQNSQPEIQFEEVQDV